MNQELYSPMDRIENLEPTEANEWLRITNLKSTYPSNDPGPGVGGADTEGCGGDPLDPPDNTNAEPGGDSYTQSD